MCSIRPGSFVEQFCFPYPSDIFGTSELIPFMPVLALELGLFNQVMGNFEINIPKHESVETYLDDLMSWNYTELPARQEFQESVEQYIFGKKPAKQMDDGSSIVHVKHIHFAPLGVLSIPFSDYTDHGNLPSEEDPVDIDQDFLLDLLGIYCSEHRAIVLDLYKIQTVVSQYNFEITNNTDKISDSDLVRIVAYHEYGHYLAYNTTITMGLEDRVDVGNCQFQELFAQLICAIIIKDNEKLEPIFNRLLKQQPFIYQQFKEDPFVQFIEQPELLPCFLYQCRKEFEAGGLSLGSMIKTTERLLNDGGHIYNNEILQKINSNCREFQIFHPVKTTGLDKRMFVGDEGCKCWYDHNNP